MNMLLCFFLLMIAIPTNPNPGCLSNRRCWRMDKRRICDGSEELRALKERLHMAKVNKEQTVFWDPKKKFDFLLFASWVMVGYCKLVFQICGVRSIFQIGLTVWWLIIVVRRNFYASLQTQIKSILLILHLYVYIYIYTHIFVYIYILYLYNFSIYLHVYIHVYL